MPDILLQIPIAAQPEKIFQALTEQSGLTSWWTDQVQAEPRVGSVAVFTFEGGQVVMNMRIAELDRPNRVAWEVADPAPPEWGGTTITFDISEADQGGSSLLFGHRGWASTSASFAAINYNWAYYLTSLKDHLEKGEGFPFVNS